MILTVFTDTFIPYEFPDKHQVLKHLVERAKGIKKSLRLAEMTNEHLMVRCPFVGDYLTITGTPEELNWLHAELTKQEWYRIN